MTRHRSDNIYPLPGTASDCFTGKPIDYPVGIRFVQPTRPDTWRGERVYFADELRFAGLMCFVAGALFCALSMVVIVGWVS